MTEPMMQAVIHPALVLIVGALLLPLAARRPARSRRSWGCR
jgi:fumarate reductase subunit D